MSCLYLDTDMNIPGGARRSLNAERSLGAESSCLIPLFADVLCMCGIREI